MKNKNGNSDQIARKYMDSLVVEERVLGAVRPDTKVTFLGEEFDTPIMAGALSHLPNGMAPYAEGAKLANAACFIGMGDNETFGACLDTGAKVIKIIKPYADREEIFSRLRYAEEHGALAVGLDGGHAIKPESPGLDRAPDSHPKEPEPGLLQPRRRDTFRRRMDHMLPDISQARICEVRDAKVREPGLPALHHAQQGPRKLVRARNASGQGRYPLGRNGQDD